MKHTRSRLSTLATAALAALSACSRAPKGDAVLAPDAPLPSCAAGETYPASPVEPMTLGEVLSAYRWPEAIRRSSGAKVALDLASVPCALDPDIDWSMRDLLLFVSIPAW